ncbi:MAG: SAP domain-containing protein [Acidobacteriota bacterium]
MGAIPPDPAEPLGIVPPPLEPLIADAIAEFKEFDVPELKEFLRRNKEAVEGLKIGGLKGDLLDRIREYIATDQIPLSTAFDYIDAMRENGRQHLFLFQIREEHRDDLVTLRASAVPFNDSLPAKPFEPKLTGILLRGEELAFRWIETRQWEQQVPAGPNQFELRLETERSVNFFTVDLVTGQAAIRMQALKSNSEKSIIEEFEIYRRLIQERVNLDHFSPLNLEPVIRVLLTSNAMKVQRWSIDWPGRGHLSGNVDPGFVESVLLRFADYVAQELAGDWLFDRKGGSRRVRATLNARANEVEIPNRCDADEERVILDNIREVPRHKMKIDALRDIARKHEGLRPAFETFDVHFAIRGQREIDLREAGGNWVVGPTSLHAARELVLAYPTLFQLRYRVRCPEKSAAEGTLYETVPESIACKHKGKNVTHPTNGITEPVLIFEPPRETPEVIPKVASAVERWLPQNLRRRVIGAVTVLLFAVVFIPIVLATTWMFLLLHKHFDTATGFVFISVAYSIILLVELGAVIKLLGNPVTELALKVLLKLASMLRWRSTAERPSKARVHKVSSKR